MTATGCGAKHSISFLPFAKESRKGDKNKPEERMRENKKEGNSGRIMKPQSPVLTSPPMAVAAVAVV